MQQQPQSDSSQPDLRAITCEAAWRFSSMPGLPDDQRLTAPPLPDDVTIRCQRTWHGISTFNPHIHGGDFSACVAQFESGGRLFSFFIEAIRPPGQTQWHHAGSSGGQRPVKMRDIAGGFMLVGGSHVCVGGVGSVPDGGMLRVEIADGSVYEATPVDNCCIVFAPVSSPPAPDDHVTVRVIDADGKELSADCVWIGDGRPPPRRH